MNEALISNISSRAPGFFEEVLSVSGIGLWEFDHGTNRFTVSNQLFAILGHAANGDPKILGDWPALIHPDDQPGVQRWMDTASDSGDSWQEIEVRCCDKHNDWVWLQLRGRVIERGFDGEPLHTAGIATVINEVKATESKFFENERLLNFLSDQISHVIWIADISLENLYYVSPSYERIWQQPISDLYANPKSFMNLIHPDDFAVSKKGFEKQAAGQPLEQEYRIVRADGSIRWIWDRGFPVFDSVGQIRLYVGLAEDITERKTAELALRSTSERLTVATQGAGIGIWEWNLQTGEEFWDDTIYRLYGFPQGTPPSYENWLSTLVEEDRVVQAGVWREASEGSGRYETEYRIRRPNGEIRCLQAFGLIERDGSGEAIRVVGVNWDITDRKRAEFEIRNLNAELENRVLERTRELNAAVQQLHDSEERLRFAMDASSIGLADFNPATGETFYSLPLDDNRHEQSVIPTREMAASLSERIHPEERDTVAVSIQEQLRQYQRYEVEYRLRDNDGNYRWIFSRGKVIDHDPSGAPIRVLGTFVDIHERKQIELQNRKLAAMVEASSDLIGTAAPNGAMEYANSALRRLLGSSTSAPLGNLNLQDIHPSGVCRRVMDEALPVAFEQGCWQGDSALVGHDGSELEVSELLLAVKEPKTGAIEYLTMVCRDITVRKQLEASLQSLVQKLQDTDRRKDEFLALLAHELRNPLAPLGIAAHMLLQKEVDDRRLPWCYGLIGRQVGHLTRLVDDLLDVSRISRGKITLHKQRIEVKEIVKQALEISLPLVENSQHELSTRFPAAPMHLIGDPVRLTQVIANLINNAAKFTAAGGHIALVVQEHSGQAVIRVTDNGIGIEQGMLHHIFDPFAQADASSDRNHGGLGLGLYLAREIVSLHGGSIEATSEGRNKGSRFVVRLPLEPATAPGDSSVCIPAEDLPHADRVLVIDDNVDAANSMAFLLESRGHDVRTAYHGQEGIEVAEAFRPDLILLDIGMPGMDGYEVCRRIRQQAWGRHIAIAAVTGWGQNEDKRKAREAGFTKYLTKPVSAADLEALLTEVRRGRTVVESPR